MATTSTCTWELRTQSNHRATEFCRVIPHAQVNATQLAARTLLLRQLFSSIVPSLPVGEQRVSRDATPLHLHLHAARDAIRANNDRYYYRCRVHRSIKPATVPPIPLARNRSKQTPTYQLAYHISTRAAGRHLPHYLGNFVARPHTATIRFTAHLHRLFSSSVPSARCLTAVQSITVRKTAEPSRVVLR
ncbi:hypothetical protein K505DRAFT_153256 [Melanomma pulvis-pyrius CBS 109.77]|uniref:Uncharacterized protein n=1 Tax=Melanomma pulvis-pyrius CBS 109.77 TaxID=1314802 RepID=A0A6A6WQP2_9PLEO|nr:hypothetical protein K505DRAFT_153256 [Melanomma pulvis-pyrius CBS 109.77]